MGYMQRGFAFGNRRGFAVPSEVSENYIGAPAIDRQYSINNAAFNRTLVDGFNPASVAGIVRKVRIFLKNGAAINDYKIGVFFKTNGNILSSRPDWGVVKPNPAQGFNEWTEWLYQGVPGFVDIEMNVQVGDMIGVRMDKQASGASGIAFDYDDLWTHDFFRTLAQSDFPYVNYTFDNPGKNIISVQGVIE